MKKFQLPEEFGRAEVRFGEREPVVIDLWQVDHTYAAIRAKHDGDAVQVYAEFGEYLAGLGSGFLGLTHAMIEGMVYFVQESVAEIKKKEPFSPASSPSPDSPASTGSTVPGSTGP